MLLYVRGKLNHVDKSALEADEDVDLINTSLHSLWSSITVTIGQNQTTLTTNDYPFLSLMQTAVK